MKHRDVWRGIDQLAESNGLTPSGLAKRAGLDATAFNPSKRTAKDGRPRWPSTESLARALQAVDTGIDDFAALIEGWRGGAVPLIGFAQAERSGFFDEAGFPIGDGWEQIRFPGLGDEPVYALEIGDASMEPAYRAGDCIIVAPGAEVKRGDRVVARTRYGEIMAKVLARRSTRLVKLASVNPDFPTLSFKPSEIDWVARILWASQ